MHAGRSPSIGSMSDDFSDDGAEDESEERMRDLLASYYGLGAAGAGPGGVATAGAGGGGAGGGPVSTRISASDAVFRMDAAEFDSSEYVRHLLRTCETADLLQRNDEMVHEIKALDSDMQMLVYENYNKFITATDTIRSMKQNVESMEGEMDILVASMDEIADKSEHINSSLASKRSQIDKLVRVRRLLKRLEFFFELPQRLQQCIDEGSFAQAVKYFKIARDTLREYSHVASFSNIQAESEELMDQLRTRLKAQIQETLEPTQMNELVQLLLELDVPAADLRPKLLQCHEQCFRKTLEEEMERIRSANDTIDLGVQTLNQVFVAPFVAAIRSFHEIFAAPDQDGSEVLEEDLNLMSTAMFDLFFQLSTSLFDPGSLGGKEGGLPTPSEVRDLATALESLLEGTRTLDAHLPTCNSSERGADFVEAFLSQRLAAGFQWIRRETLAALESLGGAAASLGSEPSGARSGEGDFPGTSVEQVGEVALPNSHASTSEAMPLPPKAVFDLVLDRFGKMMDSTQPLVQFGDLVLGEVRRSSGRATFAAFTAEESRHLVGWLSTAMEVLVDVTLRPSPVCVWGLERDASATPTAAALQSHAEDSWDASAFLQGVTSALNDPAVSALDSPSPRFALECSVLCRGFHRTFTPALAEIIDSAIPASWSAARVDDDEVQAHTRSCSNRLLEYFVELHGNEIAARARCAVRGLHQEQAPVTTVTPAMFEACLGFGTALKDAATVLEVRPTVSAMSRSETWRAVRPTSGLSSAHKGLQLDIERVFSERVQVFGEVGFSLTSILEGLAKIALKAICEQVRASWISPEAYQQLLADVQFVRQISCCFVDDASVIDGLVDETLVAAADRVGSALREGASEDADLRSVVAQSRASFETALRSMGIEVR
uniref:Vacuolar protein sorting-associated protein 51 homolog n=1 Tax=Rhizochromulina marina TaxID=1034831 RepID=A0A7S2S0E2_9STRA|mmetsp:Transcript_23453/g.68527  ORF Transcript_23453/g.68527 Transcript_23453/m.68527 type:complete len:891 (+) Transcript_23453:123-2795(+)